MKMIYYIIVLFLISCQREITAEKVEGYDVFLVAGQSNTHAGYGLNFALDAPDARIVQLGRNGADNMRLISAIEPLQHHTAADSMIGFALTFAKLYADEYLQPGRKVLIIPCGSNATGFRTSHWNRGNILYNDAVNRVKYVLNELPSAKLKAVLWHQGESDVSFGRNYRSALDAMITRMRLDISAGLVQDTVPFIAGGLVPYWTEINRPFSVIDSILRDLPNRLPKTAFADPRSPSIIRKPNDAIDAIHFDANGQREMGKRYFSAYRQLHR